MTLDANTEDSGLGRRPASLVPGHLQGPCRQGRGAPQSPSWAGTKRESWLKLARAQAQQKVLSEGLELRGADSERNGGWTGGKFSSVGRGRSVNTCTPTACQGRSFIHSAARRTEGPGARWEGWSGWLRGLPAVPQRRRHRICPPQLPDARPWLPGVRGEYGRVFLGVGGRDLSRSVSRHIVWRWQLRPERGQETPSGWH